MSVAVVKLSGSGDRLVPLGLACLQAYLKAHDQPVEVIDLHDTSYEPEPVLARPFAQPYSPRLVLNHHELPLLLASLERVREGRGIVLEEGVFSDLVADHAVRFYETPAATGSRYRAKFNFVERSVARLSGRFALVGFSVNYLNVFETALASALLKRSSPDVLVVWGGPTATQSREMCQLLMARGVCDALVLGEGEGPLLDLARGAAPEDVPGVMTADPGSATRFRHARRVPLVLDDLPSPDWTGIPLDFYYHLASVYTSRGCTSRCSFCGEWNLAGPVFRTRSPERVVADIERAVAAFGARYVILADSAVNHDRESFERLCDRLCERDPGVRLAAHFRADLTPQLAEKAARAGFDDAWIGFEAFSQACLDAMNKGSDLARNLGTIDALTEAGIHVLAMLVVGHGTPAAEMDNYRRVLDVIERSGRRRLPTAGKGERKPKIQYRPLPYVLVPGSRDYGTRKKRDTFPWLPPPTDSPTRSALDDIAAALAAVPFTFSRMVPDATVFAMVKGIQDADRAQRFSPGGYARYVFEQVAERYRSRPAGSRQHRAARPHGELPAGPPRAIG